MKSEDIHVQIDEMEHGLNLFLLDKRQILDGSENDHHKTALESVLMKNSRQIKTDLSHMKELFYKDAKILMIFYWLYCNKCSGHLQV